MAMMSRTGSEINLLEAQWLALAIFSLILASFFEKFNSGDFKNGKND